VAQLYRAWEAGLRAGLHASDRLQTPLMLRMWEDIMQLGLNGRQARVAGKVVIPAGEDVETLQLGLPGSSWKVEGQGRTQCLRVLNRPSWLLAGPGLLKAFLEVFYEDTGWSSDTRIAQGGGHVLRLEEQGGWGAQERCCASVCRANGLALGVWVNCRAVIALVKGYTAPTEA
jgi:hypothetical protein